MENTSVTPVGVAKAAAAKSRVRISTTPEERAEWVRLFEESGKSPAEFCRELGLAETTFAVWRKPGRGPAAAEPLTFTEVPPPMVEAALAANAAVSPGAVTIRLANGTRLDVTAGTDPTWLAQLATAQVRANRHEDCVRFRRAPADERRPYIPLHPFRC